MVKRVLLVGKIPPPLGGVTIHVQRLKELLEQSESYSVDYIEVRRFWKLLFIKRSYENEIIHLHTSRTVVRLLIYIIAKLTNRKLVTTMHSYRNKSKIQIIFDRYISKKISKTIAVGENLFSFLKDKYKFRNLEMVNPFIPPTKNELKVTVQSDKLFKGQGKTLCINAYTIIKEKNEDIYGIMDTLILFNKLRKYHNLNLYIVVGGVADNHFYNEIKGYISSMKMNEFVKVIIGEPLIPYLKISDIFVRPTLEDSYGISIAEALYLGKHAIASNVCIRPEGSFVYRDKVELESLLLKLLNSDIDIEKNIIFDKERYFQIYE